MILYFIRHGQTEDVAIVTHSAVIMCLQCYITNTPFHEMSKFKSDNANIIEIEKRFLWT